MNKYIVNGKELDLIDDDWKFLIILDACQYEMFKMVYREFFNKGKLIKAISPATWTLEWLEKVFSKYYENIIYISPNPFINSKREIRFRGDAGDLRYFDAKKHFYKIIDVWNYGWDNKIDKVHPKTINNYFVRNYMKSPGKRFIIHYMQPHNPFITIGGRSAFKSIETIRGPPSFSSKKGLKILKWYIRKRITGDEFIWKIRKMMNKPPDSCESIAFYQGGREAVKKVYRNEIRLALKYIKILIDSIDGKWLITSDHGERLGERHGWYGHNGPRDKWVTEVPFFKINVKNK